MSEIKWFKVLTDMFADDKIKIIQSMPEGDALLVMWFKVLAQAGKTNDGGYIYLKKNIPYTPAMFSTLFGKPQHLVELALRTFVEFGMIDIDERGYIFVLNWEKHQNIEGMDKVREQTRKRVNAHREKKRLELMVSTDLCAYCGRPGEIIEHVIPRSKGGPDESNNIVNACKSCNSSKRDKDLADFLNDSLLLDYQNVNIGRVLENPTLMNFVEYNNGRFEMKKRYCNVTVTRGNATDIEEDIDIELDNKTTTTTATERDAIYMYQNEIGIISSTISQMIQDDIATYTNEWVCDAITEAVCSNVRKYTYIRSILERWQREGRDSKQSGGGHRGKPRNYAARAETANRELANQHSDLFVGPRNVQMRHVQGYRDDPLI